MTDAEEDPMDQPLAKRPPIVLLALLGLACGRDQAPAAVDSPAEGSSPPAAATPLLPGHAATEAAPALPPGHPPLPPSGAPGALAAARLAWSTPASWIEETPSSSMRRNQYRIPGPGGDAELAVFYFGPGQGGDAMANAERWADQFTLPGGGSGRSAFQTEKLVAGGMAVLLVEVAGTYSGGMGAPSGKKAGYRLLGAIAEGPDANWFFKLTGPDATVEAERAAFRRLVASLHKNP